MLKSLIHKSHWFLKHLIRDPKWTIRRLLGYFKPPLFIFQMGKVGSSTIKNTLETRYHMCHFHTQKEFDTYCRKFPPARYLKKPDDRFDIITATRDPIGREVSAFFQNITNTGISHGYAIGTKEEVLAMSAERLIEEFFKRWEKGVPDTTVWYDRHFKTSTGIDIYAHPFDPEKGWNIIHDGKWRVLLVRFEDINRNYLEATNAFVSERFGKAAEYPAILPANVSDDKWYGELMKEFRSKIRFTPQQIVSQYDSKYCRHFYSPAEIERMKAKWKLAEI